MTRARPFADFAVAVLLVLACNLLFFGSVDRSYRNTPRKLSHRYLSLLIDDLPRSERVDLVIFGDSRARVLRAEDLCALLPGSPQACLNAATAAGDWFSSYDLFRRLEPHLHDGSTLLVCLSDYWLEGGQASELELLPRSWAYAELGEPAKALASFIPLSVARGGRMRWVHDRLAGVGQQLADRFPTQEDDAPHDSAKAAGRQREQWERIEKANVDAWYAPIDDETRSRHLRTARRALAGLTRRGWRVVLVNLPNPAMREVYVDRQYPGRRQRFRSQTSQLAAEFGIAFVDLAGRLDERQSFRDFHHVRASHVPALTRLLAEEIGRVLAGARGSR